MLSPTDAIEYRAYKKQKKLGEISLAMSRSGVSIGIGDDAQRVCERAVRIRQAAVQAPLTRLLSVREYLTRNRVKMDCVVGGVGETLTKVKTYEVKLARKYGAAEVTVAVTPSLMSACRYTEVKRELKKIRRAAKHMAVKVQIDKKYPFTAISRVARICCEVGVQYVCVPYFAGCEKLRYDLACGCLLEISGVKTLDEYKRLTGAGVGRIVTERPWEIYTEWLKETEKLEIGTVPTALSEEKKEQKTEVEKKENKTNEKPSANTTEPPVTVGQGEKPVELLSKPKSDNDYRCRLEGTELKFL